MKTISLVAMFIISIDTYVYVATSVDDTAKQSLEKTITEIKVLGIYAMNQFAGAAILKYHRLDSINKSSFLTVLKVRSSGSRCCQI